MTRLVVITVAASFAWSCGGPSSLPIAPTPAATQPPPVAIPTIATHTIVGMVTDRTASGPRPIVGAVVGLYAWNEDVLDPRALVASTETGPDGRYSVKVAEQATWIGATKQGYRYFAERIRITADVVFDIELTPLG
jgi:hypothetical protein